MYLLWYIYVILLLITVSSHYDSRLSDTFVLTNMTFDLSYIDGTEMTGYICRDKIKIAHFESTSSFGCISPRHKAFMFSGGSSGILGMGFPIDSHDFANTNLLRSITSHNRIYQGNATSHPLLSTKVFSLIIDNDGSGELQLGGVDLSRTENARIEDAFEAPILTECQDVSYPVGLETECIFRHFRVAIDSMRLGNQVLYDKASSSFDKPLTAVVDSGTTCLVLPSRAGSERIYTDIYGPFMQALVREMGQAAGRTGPSLYVGISGREVEIPYETYSLVLDTSAPSSSSSRSHKGFDAQLQHELPGPVCVISLPEFPDLFVLGDVFLRSAVVVHNLTNDVAPFLTIIPRSHTKVTETNGRFSISPQVISHAISTLPSSRRGLPLSLSLRRRGLPGRGYHRLLRRTLSPSRITAESASFSSLWKAMLSLSWTSSDAVSSLELEDVMGIEYIAFLQVGHPFQENISVIVDTGSGSLALATRGLPVDALYEALGHFWNIFLFIVLISSLILACALVTAIVCTGRKSHALDMFGYTVTPLHESQAEDVDSHVEMI